MQSWLNINCLTLAATTVSLATGILAYSLVGVFWNPSTPKFLPRQGHTVASGNPGHSGMADVQLLLQKSPRLWLPKPINWESLCQEPQRYGKQDSPDYQGITLRGCMLKPGRQPLQEVFETWLLYYSRIKEIPTYSQFETNFISHVPFPICLVTLV